MQLKCHDVFGGCAVAVVGLEMRARQNEFSSQRVIKAQSREIEVKAECAKREITFGNWNN